MPECQQAFEGLKTHLTSLATLATPEQGQGLLLYLSASPVAVSVVLVLEDKHGPRPTKRPVYYVSEALGGPKLRYIEWPQDRSTSRSRPATRSSSTEAHFKDISVRSIPCSEIADADTLSKAAANNKPLPAHVLYEVLHGSAAQDTDPSAASAPVTAITTTPDWRGSIMDILSGRSEGSSGTEVRRIRQKARGYVLIEGALYKAGICSPLLRCISQEQGAQLLKEIHEGHRGTHLAPRALVGKMLRQGLYWSTIMADAKRLNLDRYIIATKAWFNTKLAPRSFAPSDMVLRWTINPRKLQNKWEGPFVVTQASTRGAYRLARLDGVPLPHPWNAEALKKYYM
ncbi:hypothetical protein E2562_033926 [Oryza meyeriana var. granulata]|uniref:Reverse transcriptase/retrotransposon-derived protein RNase H-like domain-containing protein n=1 Tax=Oryza meyeriana var. granulata TaxID=110450 RepID=A0A6G1C251_9ORYZ|nr:hypothetical protein E2562_033926 [Oryza meyeriana var. granulata]